MNARRHSLIPIALALLATQVPAQQPPSQPSRRGGVPQSWKQIRKPPLPEFKPQQPKRIQLANGMVIFLQENHELPTIGGTARIRGGSREEPASKVSLVSIYGQVWRTGGTKSRTGDELDDFLEARAARIETGGGSDSTSISFDSLKPDFDQVFRVFLELLREPAFRDEKIVLAKNQIETAISRRNDEPGSIAGRESTRLAYGRDNPYARIAEYATVAAVTRDDLVDWHRRTVHPNNIILGIVGDFDSTQLEARLRQEFEKWPRGTELKPPPIEFSKPKPGVFYIEKDDVTQSEIRLVNLGIRRDNPDYFAVSVMNEILGGGSASRLFSNIRTRKGLAYSVGGGVGSTFDHPGVFRLSMSTKLGSTVEAIQALYEELDSIVKAAPSAAEMQRAKDAILNSFVFNFDTKEEVLAEKMAYEFYGYPQDFLERYRRGIEQATAADVVRVARKYVPKKGDLAVLVVGKQEGFDKPLATLGTVTPVDITIPGQKGGSAQPGNP